MTASEPKLPRPRRRRHVVLTALFVTVFWATAAGGAYVLHLLSVAHVRQLVIEGLRCATGASVKLASLSYSLSGHATLRGLVLENMDLGHWLARRLEADEADVEFRRPNVASLHLIVERIRARNVAVDLVELPFRSLAPTTRPTGAEARLSLGQAAAMEVERLTLFVRTREMVARTAPLRLGGLSASVHLPAGQPARFSAKGADPDWGKIDLSGTLDLDTLKGRLQVAGSDARLAPASVQTVPAAGPALARQFAPRGRVSYDLAIDLDSSRPDPVTPAGHIDFHAVEIHLAQQPHLALVTNGRALLSARGCTLDVNGSAASGAWRMTGTLEPTASSQRFDLRLSFQDCRLEQALAPESVKRNAIGGLASGRIDVRGDLDDRDSWVGGGEIKLEKTAMWKVPILDTVISMAKKVTIRPDERGAGKLAFRLDRGLIVNTGSELVSPSVAVLSPGGWVDMEGRLDLDVMVASRVIPLDGLPVVGKVVRWTREHLLRHLIKLQVTGTVTEPAAQIVPFSLVTKTTRAFFTGLWSIGRTTR